MTKQNIYDELKSDGTKLKAVNFYSLEQLTVLYQERFDHSPREIKTETAIDNQIPIPTVEVSLVAAMEKESEDVPVGIRTLTFNHSGWCEELKISYFQGVYRPATTKEYLVLRKFASKEI